MATPGAADDIEVDLQLALAVDISRSMDLDEQRLQRQGYVAAFRHRDVIAAVAAGVYGRIAVTYFEWSDPGFRVSVVPWILVAGPDDAERVARMLETAPITRKRGTSISSALFFAAGQFDDNGFSSPRTVIDVSGDGPNNTGYAVDAVRDYLVRRGITINGLPIMLAETQSVEDDGPSIADLDAYYADCVIGGPGAFMVVVDGGTSFDTAIRRKLVNEIAGLPWRLVPVAATGNQGIDCLIGEKMRWSAR